MMGATGALALLGGHAALGEGAPGRLAMRTRAGMAFITPVFVTVAGPDAARLETALDASFAGIRAVERAASLYRPDSELRRLNRDGRLERPSAHLLTLLRQGLALSADSDGAFDPTVQPLWDTWLAHSQRKERPSEATLREVLQRVDWRGVAITDDIIRFDRPGMAVTCNSLTLGHCADVVLAILAAHGIEDAFVSTGEFGASGRHPEGRDWRLGVTAPRESEAIAYTIDPFSRFAATAGDYKTFFSPDYKDHHIFDPRTGFSPPDWSAITVTGPRGIEADGLSTTLFVLDRDAGRRLLARHAGFHAHYFAKDGTDLSGPV